MRKARILLLASAFAALFSVSVNAQLSDVTQPGDVIVPSSNNSPGSEGVANAIDNTDNKYLNFDAANNAMPTGFTVTPSVGLTVVQCITLKSANDAPERDPATYTLEGSYDGTTFTLIASGDVPLFTARFQKVVLAFSNNIPFRIYRVTFPTVVNAPGVANSMQIAEVELLGFLAPTDVTQPGDPIVASSNNSPGSEGVANAIDNTDNKYLNFDAANNAVPTGFTVTPSVGGTLVTGMTLKSANDAPERDPATYTLEGSLDGVNFFPIASGDVPPFTARFQRNYIFFPNSRAYLAYRVMFPTVVNAPGVANSMQIAEVELLGTVADLPQDVTNPGDPIVASSNNSPGSEGVANAIDNTDNKYLNFDAANNALPTGFTVTPSAGLTIVSGVTLKSANDAPERDPASYTLEGSYDGVTFTMISGGSVALFPTRFSKQTILFDNKIPYLQYRVTFPTVVNAPGVANSMQIAEVELLGVLAPTDVTVPGDPIVASSNNSPGSEGVANAIDNTDNKYLNFDAANNAAPTGFTVTPGVGDTIVTGLSLKSANDAPERDPATYALEGSNDGANYVPISSGDVPPFTARFQKRYIYFPDNTKSFKSYRLMFPTVVNAPGVANSMQIAEVEFLGVTPGVVNTNPVNTLIRRQPQDTPVLLGSSASLRVILSGPWKVQWYTNGVKIPGANAATYTTPPATAADDGLHFQALVQSPQGQQWSDEVMLSIFTPSTTESIGLNWRGAGANGAPTALLFDDITGFHQQAYWNNLTGGSGSMANPTNSNNQPHPTITVDWATSGEWAAGTGNDDAMARLGNGICTSFSTDLTSAQTVTFSGVPAGTHSLIVYTIQVPLEFFNMNFQVITHDAGGGDVIQERYIRPLNSDEYNPAPSFILVTATDAASRSVGDMMRFDNLQPGTDGIIIVKFYSPGRVQPPPPAQPIRGPGVNGMQLLLNPGPVVEPPVITQAPISKNGTVGGQLVLSATASGSGLTYQWLRNGLPIAGAITPQLVLFNLSTNDIGKYSIAVANAAGRVVSRPAAVDVLQSEQITEGLILYYTFDDFGGASGVEVADSGPGHHDAGVRGVPIGEFPDGLYGSAVSFDGSASYVVVPDFPKASTALTVAGWVLATADTWGPIVNDWVAGGGAVGTHGQFQIDVSTSPSPVLNSRIAVGPNEPFASGPAPADKFDWHHFAMTANGSTMSIYWDGQLVDSADYLGTLNVPPFPWLVLGASFGSTDTNMPPATFFTGQMDDFAMWSRSLSDEEVYAIAFAGLPLSQVPPVITVAPRLNVYRGDNSVTISWRADFQGFILESSPSIVNPNWMPVQGVANNSVTIANPTGTVFFRLRK